MAFASRALATLVTARATQRQTTAWVLSRHLQPASTQTSIRTTTGRTSTCGRSGIKRAVLAMSMRFNYDAIGA